MSFKFKSELIKAATNKQTIKNFFQNMQNKVKKHMSKKTPLCMGKKHKCHKLAHLVHGGCVALAVMVLIGACIIHRIKKDK